MTSTTTTAAMATRRIIREDLEPNNPRIKTSSMKKRSHNDNNKNNNKNNNFKSCLHHTAIMTTTTRTTTTTGTSALASTANIKKSNKGRKQRFFISEQELSQYYNLSQPEAAKRLGVSVSTLKRRFYKFHPNKRWPYNYNNSCNNSSNNSDSNNSSASENEEDLEEIIPRRGLKRSRVGTSSSDKDGQGVKEEDSIWESDEDMDNRRKRMRKTTDAKKEEDYEEEKSKTTATCRSDVDKSCERQFSQVPIKKVIAHWANTDSRYNCWKFTTTTGTKTEISMASPCGIGDIAEAITTATPGTKAVNKNNHMKLARIIHQENLESPKDIDMYTLSALQKAFSLSCIRSNEFR